MRWRRVLTAPFRAAGAGLKAVSMLWSGQGSNWWPLWALRTKFDYAKEIGDGAGSSIVQAVIRWMARTFPEAPLMVVEQKPDGSRERMIGHPMTELVERPNAWYSGVLLWMATIADWALSGNAYWIKIRAGSDYPVELWWAPSYTMEPKWTSDGQTFISHYEYRPDLGRSPIKIEPRDVVHFRYGLDPGNVRKGQSPLRSLLREIFTDEEAANFTASLMRNLGVPGVVIAPDDPNVKVNPEDQEKMKKDFQAKFGGDKRGEPLVMNAPTKVSVLAFSPEQMELRSLRRIPEERVTAVFGVAAVVVGLGAGLDRSTFSNMAEAREAGYEGNIIPTQRLMAADLRTQLLPDFDEDPAHLVDFDLSRVRVLQPDIDLLYERVNKAVNGGWFTIGQALRAVGEKAGPEHDLYLRPMHIVEVPALAAGGGSVKFLKAAALPARMAMVREKLTERFEPEMRRFFEEQAKRVIARLGDAVGGNGRKAAFAVGQLLPGEEDELLAEALRPLWLLGIEFGWDAASDTYGLEGAFGSDNPHVLAALERATGIARRINDGTRDSIAEAMTAGEARGYTLQQIAYGVPDDEFAGIQQRVEEDYRNRPRTVANTQAMWATNMGAAAAYRSAGYQRVQMIDSTDHEPCASRNGRIVSVDGGMAATDAEHANGTLSLVPV